MMESSWFLGPAILGLVEGLTEFIPVSSTGHLILAERAIGYDGPEAGILDVVIQVGAILAICWLYRRRLWNVARGLPSDRNARRFVRNILLAFLPAVVVGGIAHDFIKRVLFSPYVVAISLIVGGIAILVIERWHLRRATTGVDAMTPSLSLGVGLCQLLALIPGVSRSGSTIMGGVALGIDRKTATEFSFFLAIPTMFGAAALDLYKNRLLIHSDEAAAIAVGLIVSFLVALVVVKWLVGFVGRHGFAVFGWYRIAAGLLALILLSHS